jgi:hypothetical protein
MKQKRCASWKNNAIPCLIANSISAKTTSASTANNVTWLFAINASLNMIFDAKNFFHFKKCEILCFTAKKFLLIYISKIF